MTNAPSSRDPQRNFLFGVRQALPDLPPSTTAQSFIPVVGSAWQAYSDFKEGDDAGAAFNTLMTIGELIPGAVVGVKGAKAAVKGVGVLKEGSLTAKAAQDYYRRRLKLTKQEEVSHFFDLKGIPRTVANWRNHNLFLKRLDKATHRRFTGRWGDQPKLSPTARRWHRTPDWMKGYGASAGAYTADGVQNWLYPPRPDQD